MPNSEAAFIADKAADIDRIETRERQDAIAEVALVIEMGAVAVDLGHTIHPHPTLSDTANFAAEKTP